MGTREEIAYHKPLEQLPRPARHALAIPLRILGHNFNLNSGIVDLPLEHGMLSVERIVATLSVSNV